jgi:molybdenum cofactor cytidylyltransferase
MPDPSKPAVVVLAAGASSRFGRPKQLLLWNGESLLVRTVRLALQAADPVVVVLGAHADYCSALLEVSGLDGYRVVRHPHWRRGMGSSLAAGVRSLPEDAQAVLVLLMDQPGIEAADLEKLVEAWQSAPDRIVASRFDGRLGPPAVLPARLFPSLITLQGEGGARDLIAGDASAQWVELPAAGIDIDTPADLVRAREPL